MPATHRTNRIAAPAAIAGLLALLLPIAAAVAPAHALGDDSDNVPTCKKGEVWDSKAKKCVKQTSAIPDSDLTPYAYSLAKAGRYDEALQVLDLLADPNTPKALNYRGYATRKLGRTDEGIGYYLQSVSLDPAYPKVREYLGEAYALKGETDLALDQLDRIEALCGKTCPEYVALSAAIEQPGTW